jgi:hypothetical protein
LAFICRVSFGATTPFVQLIVGAAVRDTADPSRLGNFLGISQVKWLDSQRFSERSYRPHRRNSRTHF